jgi:hypothetical protein
MNIRQWQVSIVIFLTIGCAASRPPANAERFVGNAINANAGRAAGMTSMRIEIDTWSSPEERATLANAFNTGGPDALLRALQSMPARGIISVPGHLGWNLHFTWQRPEASGRTIYILTDRWISFFEASRNTRTMDNPFTFVELHLDAEDHGEGTLSVATEITYNAEKKVLELEHWSMQPIRLTELRRE